MGIKKVWVEDYCISSGLCEGVCPEVFSLIDIAVVNDKVSFDEFEAQIKEAAEGCPVEAIKYEEE